MNNNIAEELRSSAGISCEMSCKGAVRVAKFSGARVEQRNVRHSKGGAMEWQGMEWQGMEKQSKGTVKAWLSLEQTSEENLLN